MKYTVYKTINLNEIIDNHYCEYIGVHQEIDINNISNYIGCGVVSTQPHTYENPSTNFQKAVAKYGPENFKKEILYIYDNINDAYAKEEELVNYDYLKLPYVYNMVLGGKLGVAKSNFNLNTLPVYQFDINGNLLRYWNSTLDIAKHYNVSCKRIGNIINGGYLYDNTYLSHNEIIDISNRPKDHRKCVYLYNDSGNFIQQFKSRTDCASFLNCCPQSISKAIIQKSRIKNHYVSNKLINQFIPKVKNDIKKIPIHVYDVNNNYYGVYIYKELFPIINLYSTRKIWDAIYSNNGWYKNYYLTFNKIDSVPNKVHFDMKKVSVYDLDGNFIQEFKSIIDARRAYKINQLKMQQYLWGMRKHNKYIFKYSK